MAEPPDTDAAPPRPGEELDVDAVTAFLRGTLPQLSGPVAIRQFPHGRANFTYLVTVGATRLVLRRPPHGTLAPGAHDMAREYRVLSRLWRAYDRAPRAHAFSTDPAVVGAPFLVMEHRTGVVLRGEVPAALAGHPDLGRRVGRALVDAMADLHLVDPACCDLADLGRPDGFVARQVAGWADRWERVKPAGADPLMAELGERLAATVPVSQRATLVHNDLKLDNCQFDPADPDRVSAVFDWDMATLGDPLVDLGTLLQYWPGADDPPEVRAIALHPGGLDLPTRAEVIERYAARTGLDPAPVPWYLAFARWKTATVYQQLHDRYLRGHSADQRAGELGDRVPHLARSAAALLDGVR